MEHHIAAYVQKILGYVNDEPLTILASTPRVLQDVVRNLSEDQLKRRPAELQWSVAEILAHLADSELAASFRVRKIISEPGSNIAAYDQLAWCSALDYAQQPTADSLRVFTAVREANVRLYERLTPEQWNAYGIHSERGEESVKQLLTLLAGHDRNHISQI